MQGGRVGDPWDSTIHNLLYIISLFIWKVFIYWACKTSRAYSVKNCDLSFPLAIIFYILCMFVCHHTVDFLFSTGLLVGLSATLVKTEVSQLLDGSTWDFIQTFMVPRGWRVIPSLREVRQALKSIWNRGQTVQIQWHVMHTDPEILLAVSSHCEKTTDESFRISYSVRRSPAFSFHASMTNFQ